MTNVLTRDDAIPLNKDPRGIKWGVFPQTGRNLYLVGAVSKNAEGEVVPDEKQRLPEEVTGEFTHPSKAQFAIEQYLNRAWEESEATEARLRAKRPKVQEEVKSEEEDAGTENG